MDPAAALVPTLFAAQAVLAVVLAALFGRYAASLQWRVLRLWALAFAALAVYSACAALSLVLVQRLPSAHPARLALTLVSQLAAYAQVLWLLLGVLELAHPGRLTRRQVLFGTLCIGLLAAATTFPYAFDPAAVSERMLSRVGLRYGLSGLSFVIAAAGLWLFGIHRRGLGPQVLMLAFALYGLHLLHSTAVLYAQVSGALVGYAPLLGIGDLLGYSVIGLGLVIWLQEESAAQAEAERTQAERLRFYDPMTGLPNRNALISALDRLLAGSGVSEHRVQLYCVELQRSAHSRSLVSDTDYANAVAAVARALGHQLQQAELIAQVDAQRFALLLAGEVEGSEVISRTSTVLAQPIESGAHTLYFDPLIGSAKAPDDANNGEGLLKCAEAALNAARAVGVRARAYSGELGADSARRLAFENEIREALARGQFELHLQRIVDSRTLAIGGFEALVRWPHPTRGLLRPAQFIGEIEALGLLPRLDELVLQQAIGVLARWGQGALRELFIAVNLSAPSLRQAELPALILRRLQDAGVPPARLQVEVTESAALGDLALAQRWLAMLQNAGISVALDDFGTGYSSLTHLRRLPVRKVKLDQSFVRDVLFDARDARIVSALVELAHGLDLEVVAEGIESLEQVEFLKSLGVEWLQGYRFYPPQPIAQVEALVGTTLKAVVQARQPET